VKRKFAAILEQHSARQLCQFRERRAIACYAEKVLGLARDKAPKLAQVLAIRACRVRKRKWKEKKTKEKEE
jgi:hypothetical protein